MCPTQASATTRPAPTTSAPSTWPTGTSLRTAFAEISPGVPDGFRCDTDGNVWTSAQNGVHCYAPDGTLLGRIRIPTMVSNLTFGGERRNRLFITATNALYSVFVAARGAQTP